MQIEIPSQTLMKNSISGIPIEYFEWGSYPDHFRKSKPHRHAFDELMFFYHGNGTHEINFINYEVSNWSVHYIPNGTVHFLSSEEESRGFTISFQSEYFEKNNIHKFLNPISNQSFILDLEARDFEYIVGIKNQIRYQIQIGKSSTQKKCFLVLMELLLFSLDGFGKSKYRRKEEVEFHPIMRQFRQLVENNLHIQHEVGWYAREMHISPKYLSNIVKSELDISAKRFIQSGVLLRVKHRLFYSDHSIGEISRDFGYDPSSLGKIFKKYVGMGMKEYRMSIKVE